jgi:hypothetical protein
VIGRGTGAELRARAGTDILEAAFLVLSGLDPEGNPIESPPPNPGAPTGGRGQPGATP